MVVELVRGSRNLTVESNMHFGKGFVVVVFLFRFFFMPLNLHEFFVLQLFICFVIKLDVLS